MLILTPSTAFEHILLKSCSTYNSLCVFAESVFYLVELKRFHQHTAPPVVRTGQDRRYLGQVLENGEAAFGDGDVHGVFGADADDGARFRKEYEVISVHGTLVHDWVVLDLLENHQTGSGWCPDLASASLRQVDSNQTRYITFYYTGDKLL